MSGSDENNSRPEKNISTRPLERPKPGILGELRRSLTAHTDAQQGKIHDGDGSNRQRESDDVEALESRKDQLRRI